MSANTSIELTDHWREFAQRKVDEGRYSSTSEVVREGLRLLEEEEQKLNALRKVIAEGEASGPAEEMDWNQFLREVRLAD